MNYHDDPILWLQQEFCSRRNSNPRYSLRAFARDLDVAPAAISELLSRKRTLTLKTGRCIANSLDMPPETRNHFFDLIEKHKQADNKRTVFIKGAKRPKDYKLIEADEFAVIADWYHFGILGLMKTDTFRSDHKWIAKRLGISVIEARSAVERLVRLGLVREEDNTLVRTFHRFTTTTDVPSSALRLSHKQTLEQAIESLTTIPVEKRDITSATLALDPINLPLAKKLINEFQKSILEIIEDGPKTEVYTLNIQLYPISKEEEGS